MEKISWTDLGNEKVLQESREEEYHRHDKNKEYHRHDKNKER
jgi:hypothetical protein